MHVTHRGVNQAFVGLVAGIANGQIPAIKAETRNGPVLQVSDPIIVTYEHPLERVLFNRSRDANPGFHLYESLFMLAGRNEIAPLAYYAEQMKQYSDDGVTQNGAYGYRWRKSNYWDNNYYTFTSVDQIKVIVDHLKKNPSSRRAVLSIYNVEDDLLKIDTSRDIACNTTVMFSLRDRGAPWPAMEGSSRYSLDMTVTNRSNDLIWGCLGANVVHFSFLQEYMAAQLGVEVGKYHQFSNNLHVYTETNSGFKPDEWLAEEFVDYRKEWKHVPLVKDPKTFDEELLAFVEVNSGKDIPHYDPTWWKEPFFVCVAQPMLNAFHCHKKREYSVAESWCGQILDNAWSLATTNWINKRRNNWEAKQGVK